MPTPLILIAMLLGHGCYSLATPHASHSRIQRPSYAKLIETIDKSLRPFSKNIHRIQYGKSVGGKPLFLYVIGKKKTQLHGSRPALFMTGNTHGDEYLNIEDRLPAELLSKSKVFQSFIEQDGVLIAIPVLNPDGFEKGIRDNSHGIDLNRDWGEKDISRMEPESRALKIQIEKMALPPWNMRYHVSVDYHCCTGAVLYPQFDSKKAIINTKLEVQLLLAYHAENILKVPTGTTAQILGYSPKGTTKDYFSNHFHTTAFTFEGREGEENKYLNEHIQWWEKIVQSTLPHSPRTGKPIQAQEKAPVYQIAD